MLRTKNIWRNLHRAFGLVALVFVVACAQPGPNHPADQPFDPYEAENRRMHEFNRAVDRNLYRPAGKSYSNAIPDDIETVVGRFASNLAMPSSIMNNILQGNMRAAFQDTGRMLVNSTLGIAGLFDPATDLNMPQSSDADFGQTLHVWGARPGPYIELPFIGPSTTRDTWGIFVDALMDPLNFIIGPPESFYATGTAISSRLSDRGGRFADTIDSILYESEDSYAQARSIYVQNRNFKLGGRGEQDYLDPYDDPYAVTSQDFE